MTHMALFMHTWKQKKKKALTKVLIVLSLKFILSVYPVKKRGTYEGGEGHPADCMSSEHGIPLSRLTNGRPEKGAVQNGVKLATYVE